MKTIAFIGTGAIAISLVKGLIRSGYPAPRIIISSPQAEKKFLLLAEQGVNVETDNKKAIIAADVVVIAVKAQVVLAVTDELSAFIQQQRPLVISIAGGTTLENLQKKLGNEISIIRAMPNLAAAVGKSATTLCANCNATKDQKLFANLFFKSVGEVFWHPNEKLMDAATALGGCGLAYVFLTMESFVQAAEHLGLEKTEVNKVTQLLFEGAVELLKAQREKETKEMTPEKFRVQVTTPNGVTESAIKHLVNSGMPGIYSVALKKANDRSAELTRMLSSETTTGPNLSHTLPRAKL